MSRLRLLVRPYVLVEGLAAVGIVVGLGFWLGLAIDWLLEPRPGVRVVMGVACRVRGRGRVAIHCTADLCAARNDSLALLVERKHPQLAKGWSPRSKRPAKRSRFAARQMLDVSGRRTDQASATCGSAASSISDRCA